MPGEGIYPGPRECHDAQPGRLRVDFAYQEALSKDSPFAPRPMSGGAAASDLALGKLQIP